MLKQFIANLKIPLRYHIYFWLGYFLFNVVRWGTYFNDYIYSFKANTVEFPLHILTTYFTVYYLIPRFILRKKYLTFFICLVFTLLGLYMLRTGLNFLLVSNSIWPESIGLQEAFTFNHIIAVTLGELYVIAIVATIKLTYEWVAEKRKNDALQKMQLQTELDFLRSQIQPHFFFNTLNNLYSLVIKKSENAPDVVLKLSEIMQYVLYEVKSSKISLLKEINYIYSYLELEKLRYGDTIDSQLEIEGDLEGIEVPPLLFLPFIENCFKHGAKKGSKIRINFEIKNNFLFFTVTNAIADKTETNKPQGIGIQNIKRRLELLYPKQYRLKTISEKGQYKVDLKLPIQ